MIGYRKHLSAILLILITICSSCKERRPPNNTVKIQPSIQSREENKARFYNLDKSPMDIVYFPEDFPVLKMSGKVKGTPVARVVYSRPSKDGRSIFGNVVKYGTYWRLGANEGTEIEFFKDISIYGKRVKKGRYIIYCIPYEKKWTLKLNDDLYSWGLRIHSSRDVYSFDVPVIRSETIFELLTMKFEKTDNGARLMIAWDNVRTALPFKY